MKRAYQSGTKWENIVSYSRAIRTGNVVQVSGTTATDEDGNIVGPGNPTRQTQQTIANIETALKALDATLEDVIRTRIYVTNIDQWEEIGHIHGEVFKGINPVTTMVEVSRLIDPAMLVEIEAEAIVSD